MDNFCRVVVSPTSVPPDRTACPENRDRGSASHWRRASGTGRRKKSAASWGLRPRRLAAFGRPGSLKRSSHPASPMMSRLRRHVFCWIGGSFKRCASMATTAPAAPSQLAFQKSQADRAAIEPRGQGRRKRRGRGDFRAAGRHSGRSAGWRGRAPHAALRASQAADFLGARSSHDRPGELQGLCARQRFRGPGPNIVAGGVTTRK